MGERVTSLQVAERAGVSQSAVSRTFTPGASVSPKTAAKIRKAAEELGYRPNNLARSLITGRSRIVGLVVAYLENYFYPEALEKFSNALQARGYHVLIFMAAQNAGNIDEVLQEILDYQVDGIIMASASLSSDFALRCQTAGVPVVFFNRRQDIDGISSVTCDNHAGGRQIADFLVAGGHTRFGYIAGWHGASTQRDREAGFVDGLAQKGHSLHAREVGNFDAQTARAAALAMFETAEPPDAVFVANDHMAFQAMDVIRFNLGLRIPEDVSVVGFDDVPPAAWKGYDLTTIRQRANLMVKETVATLLAQIDEAKTPPRQVRIDAPLIVRRSARIPEGWVS